ncbi:MAG: nucleotidyltransferase domain-containing protein [Nitrososphaerota archaeon]|nr:nucleotidyltransferase domain-containing protein [Nitrososphaerota archaeon]
MLKEKFKEIEDALLQEIKSFYGERLVTIALFGSVARGTYTFDSDIDILIIAKDLPQGRMKRVREFETVEEKIEPLLSAFKKEGLNTYLSPIIKSPEEAKIGSPLFLDMVEDVKILFDRDNFFSNILARLKQRLKELGSIRVWKGDAWYWILKPDLKPGEIIEL